MKRSPAFEWIERRTSCCHFKMQGESTGIDREQVNRNSRLRFEHIL